MANNYGPATEPVCRLLRANGFDPEQIKVKYVDDQKIVGDNYNTGHEIWIVRGHCRKWL